MNMSNEVYVEREEVMSGSQLPRLLLVSNFLSSKGGCQTVMENLADKLSDSGSSLICASSYHSSWIRCAHMWATTFFRRKEYDLALVDLFSGRAFIWGETMSILLYWLRCPFVLVLRGGGLPEFAMRYPRRVKACINKANAVAVPSQFLLEKMCVYRSDLCLIPNPLDVSACVDRIRINPRPKLVWLRSFHKIYNPSLAPRVVSLLRGDFPDINLTMVGPDKGDGSFQRTQQVAVDLGVSDRIIYPGLVPQAEVSLWMNNGEIFLNTTNIDNTPVSVAQAMASGLCVVTTDVGGIRYLLKHEHDGLLVPPDDPAAMATAVRRILTEPGLAEHLSRNARRKAELFDWSIVLPQWKKLLKSVAKGNKV